MMASVIYSAVGLVRVGSQKWEVAGGGNNNVADNVATKEMTA